MILGFRGVHYVKSLTLEAPQILYSVTFSIIKLSVSLCLVDVTNTLLVNHVNLCVDSILSSILHLLYHLFVDFATINIIST